MDCIAHGVARSRTPLSGISSLKVPSAKPSALSLHLAPGLGVSGRALCRWSGALLASVWPGAGWAGRPQESQERSAWFHNQAPPVPVCKRSAHPLRPPLGPQSSPCGERFPASEKEAAPVTEEMEIRDPKSRGDFFQRL